MDTKELVTDTVRPARGARRAEREQLLLGPRQLDAHRGRATSISASRTASSRCRRRCRAASGASRRTMPAASIATPTNRRCTSISCRRRTTRAIPNLLRTRGSYERWPTRRTIANVVWPVRPNPGTNRAYQARDRSRGRHAARTSRRSARRWSIAAIVCRPTCTATCSSPSRRRISSAASIIDDDGTTLRARKAYDNAASSWRRPTSASARSASPTRPTARSTSSTCIAASSSSAPTSPSTCAITSSRTSSSSRPASAGSIASCTRRRSATRSTGAGEASRRRSSSRRCRTRTAGGATRRSGCWSSAATGRSSPALVKLADEREGSGGRGCTRCGRSTASTRIEPATVDQGARRSVARRARRRRSASSERWLGEPNSPMQAAVLKRLDDPDWSVREQLAASLGALPPGPRERAVGALLERARRRSRSRRRRAERPARQRRPSCSRQLLQATRPDAAARDARSRCSPRRSCAAAQDAAMQNILRVDGRRTRAGRGSDRRCCAGPKSRCSARRCRDAGAARRGGRPAGAPCPTCPGGRGGPGGAYAFPQRRPRGGAPRRAAPTCALSAEPAALSALARDDDAILGPRAANVLARIEWPGKPGAAAPVAPLTPDEQQRFNAGQEVYQQHLPGLSSAGWPRTGAASPPSLVGLAARARVAGHSGADPAERQGRSDRSDAAGRFGVERRSDRRRADLHPPRVGPDGTPVDPRDVKTRARDDRSARGRGRTTS